MNHNHKIIQLSPSQVIIHSAVHTKMVSILITTKNLMPVKWIPLDFKKIFSDIQYFLKRTLTTLIEEQYIALSYLSEGKIFLGVTDSHAQFTVYRELQLCSK